MTHLDVAQYGYLTMFAPAYSLMPMMALFDNIFTIRVEAVNFCRRIRRPTFRVCEDIGAWFSVLSAFGFIALLNNISMIAFVGNQFSRSAGCDCGAGVPSTADLGELFGAATCADACWEQEGIVHRVTVQRLWALSLLAEHAVLLVWLGVRTIEPMVPAWIAEARDTLEFRVDEWKCMTGKMEAAGHTTAYIQHMMWLEEATLVKEAGEEIRARIRPARDQHLIRGSRGYYSKSQGASYGVLGVLETVVHVGTGLVLGDVGESGRTRSPRAGDVSRDWDGDEV